MSSTYRYYGFGIDFQSAIPIPEMREGSAGHAKPVAIRIASATCPENLPQIDAGVAAGPQDFWMDVPGVVRLHVASGVSIAVDPAPGAAIGDIRSYLLGSAMGALLHQRGLLPLHASAVEIDGKAVAFCGASGAGKSSLALHLVKRGHRLISDDICAIDTASGAAQLWPGLINLKLWRESLEAAGEQHDGLQPVLPTLDKYKLPVPAIADYCDFALGGIALLAKVEEGEPHVTAMHGAEGLSTLVSNTFRGQLIGPMAQQQRHFDHCVAIAANTRIVTLARPWSLSTMDATCALFETEFRKS
jgi:HPr Serine kinase C-terminal domain